MTKIDLKVGFLCNNKCEFCVQGNKRTVHGDIPTNQVLNSLEEGRKSSNQVVITGGEPTIKKDFLKIVAHAKKIGYELIQIQTNGRMFASQEFTESTIDAGANSFSIGLHGHNKNIHDNLTQAKHSFFQAVNGIQNLKKLNQFVGTNTVIVQKNYMHLEEIAKMLVFLEVDQFQLAFVHAIGTANELFETVTPRYKNIMPHVKSALDIGIENNLTVMTEAIPYCFMHGYEKYIGEKIIPHTKIFDVNILEDYTEYRLNEGKQKSNKCQACKHFNICEGPWKEYPENFGWDEMTPVV